MFQFLFTILLVAAAESFSIPAFLSPRSKTTGQILSDSKNKISFVDTFRRSALGLLSFADDDDEYDEIFRDDFDLETIDESKWSFEYGRHNGWGNGEQQSYTSDRENCFIKDNALNVRIVKLDQKHFDDAWFTSARLTTHRKFNFTFGRIEARVQVSHQEGPFSAIWALSDKKYDNSVKWPLCGEIDLFEYQSIWNYTPQTLHFFEHNGNDNNELSYHSQGLLSPGKWHNVTVDWTPDYIAFFLDGKFNGMYEKPPKPTQENWPYDEFNSFHLVINNAMSPSWAKPSGEDFKEHTLKVDHITISQKKEKPPGSQRIKKIMR